MIQTYPFADWEKENSIWCKVTHSHIPQQERVLKPHEIAVIKEQRNILHQYMDDPVLLELFLTEPEVPKYPTQDESQHQNISVLLRTNKNQQDDLLYQSTAVWSVCITKLASTLYQQHATSKHIYRVFINANMVSMIMSTIPETMPETAFEIESDLRGYYLSLMMMSRVIESGREIITRRVLRGTSLKNWRTLIFQAETLLEELTERIFLLHCKLASLSKT